MSPPIRARIGHRDRYFKVVPVSDFALDRSPDAVALRGYEAARADLERRWPNVGVEDLRRVVAAFDAFQAVMSRPRR